MVDVDVNTKDFITGLKTIIRTSWPTQEEFASGVTSKVNLSNILRGVGGTSYTMRKALAQKAGMTIDEVTKIGRIAETTPSIRLSEIMPGIGADVEDEDHHPIGGSSNDIMETASEYTFGLHSTITQYAKSMLSLVKDITGERDRLVSLLAQEQVITNTVNTAIKLVSRDKRVLYVNRAMMEKFHTTPGDQCTKTVCGICKTADCVIDSVFVKGKVTQLIGEYEGEFYLVTGYPIMDKDWKVCKALVTMQSATVWIDLLKAQGWTPPSDGNKG